MSSRATPAQIVASLAALAPDAAPVTHLGVPVRDRAPLPLTATRLFEPAMWEMGRSHHFSTPDGSLIESLLKRARLSGEQDNLNVGWLWASTTGDDDRVFTTPLVSVPVGVDLTATGRSLLDVLTQQAAAGDIDVRGDIAVSRLITDPDARDDLERSVTVGGGALHDEASTTTDPRLLARLGALDLWIKRACRAAGLPKPYLVDRVGTVPPRPNATEVVAQVMLYVAAPPTVPVSIAGNLRRWCDRPIGHTALAEIYDVSDPPTAGDHIVPRNDARLAMSDSPLMTTPTQRRAIERSRTDAVTVISGPPGGGKTQTVAAIALDSIEAGRSVLIAAPGDAAVSALLELLDRTPAIEPIVFGSSAHRLAVADRLGQGGGALTSPDELDRRRRSLTQATSDAESLHRIVDDLLTSEQLAALDDPARVIIARRAAPRWFALGADLQRAEQLLQRASATVSGPFAGFRHRRRHAALRSHAGADADVSSDALGDALNRALTARSAAALEASGGLDLTTTWPKLIEAEDRRRRAHSDWLDAVARSSERVDKRARTTMALVAAALRSGRSQRRDKLAEIDGRQLTSALPLWLGTLRDIDDLLPPTPGMFDLVIIDEASQVDQITAAPALLRGHNAVVVGDPKQLRHVSFLADVKVDDVQTSHDVLHPIDRGRLDVRRLSAFDLAASSAPTTMLDEHFRSAPHLIGFSMRRFYEGQVSIATTHPRNHALDCIDVEHLDGRRSEAGVNEVEVRRVIEIVRNEVDAASHGVARSVGVVTPFRAQADAIEQEVIDTFTLADIEALRLRVGTVHGFQGCERDLIVISTAIDDEKAAGSRAFLNDPNLFNVMVTRARHKVTVLISARHTEGLIGEYVRWAEAGPRPPASTEPGDRRVEDLAHELRRAGLATRTGYPAGRHRLDLVIGEGERALGVTFGVHADGPAAHIERRLALAAQGWDVFEVFESRWRDRLAELAIELVRDCRQRG